MRTGARLGLGALAVVLLGGVVLAAARYALVVQAMLAGSAASVAPQGQRPFEILDAKNFDDLRDLFNAHPDRTRVLALLSPT